MFPSCTRGDTERIQVQLLQTPNRPPYALDWAEASHSQLKPDLVILTN